MWKLHHLRAPMTDYYLVICHNSLFLNFTHL